MGNDATVAVEEPPTTDVETRSWIMLDVGSSVYSSLAASGFLPLLIESQALTAAGYPDNCPNVIRNTTLLHAAFSSETNTGFWTSSPPVSSCAGSEATACVGTLCPGLPGTLDQCRSADGRSVFALRAGGLNPTAMASLFVSLSVACQAIVFLFFGPCGDFGKQRRAQLYWWTAVGGLTTALAAATTPSSWWLGGALLLISNPSFGMAMIMANAYLPMLVRNLPSVAAARADPAVTADERYALVRQESDALSSRGFAWGFVGGLIGIALVLPLTFFMPTVLVYQIAQGLAGVWWVVITFACTWRTLPARPGPPPPPGTPLVCHSLDVFRSGLCLLARLPSTALYLITWFFLSDAVFVISAVGGLYANSRVDWGCSIPKSLGVAGLFLLVPIFAALGGFAYQWLSTCLQLRTRTTLFVTLCVFLLIPLYGMLAYSDLPIGLKQGWEVWLVGVVFGSGVGAFQAFSRSLFSTLLPRGREAVLNSLYEVTDKGSSFIGPAVMAALAAGGTAADGSEIAGDLRPGFFYIIGMLLFGMVLLLLNDVETGAKRAAEVGRELLADEGGSAGAGGDVEMTSPTAQAALAVATARRTEETHVGAKAAEGAVPRDGRA